MARKRRRKRSSGLPALLAALALVLIVVVALALYQAASTGRISGAKTQNTGGNAQPGTGTTQTVSENTASQDSDIVTGTIFDPENGSARTYDRTNNGEIQTADGGTAGADGTNAGTNAGTDAASGSASAESGSSSTAGQASDSQSAADDKLVYVAGTNVNIRSAPSTDSQILGQAQNGAQLTKTGEDGEWTSFDYNGQTAWIKTEFLSAAKPSSGSSNSGSSNSEWNLAELDNEAANFGYNGANRDANNVPTDWEWYESKWGQFDVDWIQDTSKNTIYLTMDEGFGNDNTITILDTLKEKNVNVTFFLTKNFTDERPELVQRMLDEGHQLGNHTCTHPKMPTLSIEEQTDQIMTLHNLIKDQFGYEMSVFRYPEGVYSSQSLGLVNNLGYKAVFWSYAYGDYDEQNQPPVDESLKKALDALHNGAIYLLHASSDTNTAFLADFIDGARAQGFEFGRYPLD